MRADSARASGTGVVVEASPATLVCGGPDDLHYDVASTTEELHVLPGAQVSVIVLTSGVATQQIPAASLPQWLATDQAGRTFQVTGPAGAVTALTEQYHP